VSEPASISNGIAARYAAAVFGLAAEGNALATLETDIDALEGALAASPELRDLIASPIYSREDQGAAIAAIGAKIGLATLTNNTLALMAANRRLFVLPHLLAALREMIATEKGEVTAEVASAKALTKAQQDALVKTLTAKIGKNVKLNMTVDGTLIGGLVVKVGSRMIDTSIRAKLNTLQNTMKEVG